MRADLPLSYRGSISKVALNLPAPDFELADYSGKRTRLSDFLGRHVLLIFNRGFI